MTCVVPLRVVLTSMILFVAIVAAAVSFAPLYTASLSSATDSGEAFSESISREVVSSVSQNFGVMQSTTSAMVTAAHLGGWSDTDIPGIIKWMNYGVTLGADSINMFFDGVILWTAGHTAPNGTTVPKTMFVLIKYNATYGETYYINATDRSVISGPTYFRSVLSLGFRTAQFYPVIRQRQTWGNPYIGISLGISEAILPCGAPIVLPNGTAIGAFNVRTRAKVIVDYMQSLTIAATGRAMLVDPLTRIFLGSNNRADPLVKRINGTVVNGTVVNGTVVNALYTDVVDPLIRKVVNSLGPQIITCSPLPCAFKVGAGNDMTFVVVSGVNDSYNLNKRLVVMIPSEDFLGDIRTAASTSLGAAAGAVVGLLLLSVIAVYFVIRPLQRLEAKLYASVTLEEDDVDSAHSKSMFTEILRIEEAYDKLQAELKKVKSFLPQSVLKQLEQQDGDEDEDNEEAEEGGIEEMSHSRGSSSANAPTLNRRSVAVASSNGRASHRTDESRYSHNTMRSRTSEGRRQAIERGRTLNTSTGLTSRMCTVVMTNMDGLHRHLKSPHELAGLHTRVMGVIAAQVDECKGVLDAFHGDRFTLTFNSSTNCASHCTKAAQFVLQVTAALTAQAKAQMSLGASSHHGKEQAAVDGPGIRFGVATGKALCGNLGTDKIKRFCTLGPVLNHAQVLVDMCRVYGVTNLASGEALKGMSFEYVCDNVTIGVLPASSNAADVSLRACLVGSVRERKSSKMDEWMYELQEGEAHAAKSTGDVKLDTIVTMSYALEKLFAGDCMKATAALESLPLSDEGLLHRLQHVRQLIAKQKQNEPFPLVSGGLF